MSSKTAGSNPLRLFLFRVVAALILITYLYLEENASYQLSIFAIALLIWIGNYYWRHTTILYLFSVFLLSLAGLYSLHYGFSTLIVLVVYCCFYIMIRLLASPYRFTWKRHGAVMLIVGEAALLGSYLPVGLFAYATLITILGSFDIYYHGPVPAFNWNKSKKHGMLSLFGARGQGSARKKL